MTTKRRGEMRTHAHSHCDSLSESALVDRCQAGDPDAWNTLFHRYAGSVYNAAFSLCHNREEANDIVGQVFLQLYQHLNNYRRQAGFHTWLLAIVRNTFIDQCIRPAHKKNLSLDVALTCKSESFVGSSIIDPASSPEALCMQHDAEQMLARAVRGLPVNQRRTLCLYYTEGKSYEEIAIETCVPLATVKSRMHRARNLLRERLTPDRDVLLVAYSFAEKGHGKGTRKGE
ncbi:MAG: polymerase, sigma-24 subunit, RpoE [Chthonomonadaceae bacterium]|nr:polymerase, sigma-24 subunit, RpoE [Chthonomonadaceae bacterium]